MGHARSTFDIDARIRAIGSTQLGLLTVDQAARCGVDKHALARCRDAGALIPLFPNVMRLVPVPETPGQRVLAAALAVPGSVAAATSAAVVHRLPIPAQTVRDGVVLSVPAARRVRVPGIVVVRHAKVPPSTRWMTARLATPATTVLLLPRFADDDVVERCLDHCLAHRLVTVATMRALLGRTAPHAVYRRQFLLELLDARRGGIGHRSGTEQRVGRWLDTAGLRDWKRNHRVRVGTSDFVEVDFGWTGIRLALEASPFFTHGSRRAQERDAERRRLLTLAGWRVLDATDAALAAERAFGGIVATLRSLGAT